MKIHFTKKEYEHLIDLLFLGEWMLSANDNNKLDNKNPHQQVIQKIYSYAAKMQCEHKIKYEKQIDAYCPTRNYEENSMVFDQINAYDEECFWQELIGRLGLRDAEKMFDFESASIEEKIKHRSACEDIWAEEFAEHGLLRLTTKNKGAL